MKPFRVPPIPGSEITSESVYLQRRRFLRGLGLAAPLLVSGCSRGGEDAPVAAAEPAGKPLPAPRSERWQTGEELTSWNDATHYNNYYEFGTGRATRPATPAASSRSPGPSKSPAMRKS